jgi:eukaryotic-like serine/threonine-protein kinase
MDSQQPPPQRIGRYEIQRELGRGSMGVVYQAKDTVLQRNVALKTISLRFAVSDSDRRTFEARFLQEARAAATLAHPGIVVVYDVGVDPETGTPYMALEFLRGKTLESVLAAGQPLDWRQALRTVARVAEALEHAHAHGIVHRDIKPANIMVLASGEPKIMDFGVAKVDTVQLTTGGRVLGTPHYMSPEQAGGQRLDGRSDVFALGAVLYELLTGKKAFPGPTTPEVLRRLLHEDPVPPSTMSPGLPAAVDGVAARALAKQTAARYASGKALAEDIEDILAERPPRHLGAAPSAKPIAPPEVQEPLVGQGTVRAGAGSGVFALPPGKRVSLAILSGTRQGEVFVLARPTALIGRSGGRAGADIELADPETSRAHAVVECHGSRIVVRDLGSTNGTYVEDERVEEEATLEDQGEFRVGNTRIMLVVSDAE